MQDAQVVLRKLKIWLAVVTQLPPGKKTLSSPCMRFVVSMAPCTGGGPDQLIIHSVYVEPDCRGRGLWSAFADQLQGMGRPLLLQSVLNARLLKSMLRRPGWRVVEGELSVAYM